jgi:hypothetical protein
MAQNGMRTIHVSPNSMHMCLRIYTHVHSACLACLPSPMEYWGTS